MAEQFELVLEMDVDEALSRGKVKVESVALVLVDAVPAAWLLSYVGFSLFLAEYLPLQNCGSLGDTMPADITTMPTDTTAMPADITHSPAQMAPVPIT